MMNTIKLRWLHLIGLSLVKNNVTKISGNGQDVCVEIRHKENLCPFFR